MSIKPIETTYNGCRFRSRLEARWAVFFDALGIRWEYEPQGFEVSSHYEDRWYYLPDFHLPDLGTWVEVKGTLEGLTADYFEMVAWAIDFGGALPGVENSIGTTRGLLWLGPIPSEQLCRYGAPAHAILQHLKGGYVNTCNWYAPATLSVVDEALNYFDSSAGDGPTIQNALSQIAYSGQWVSLVNPCDPPIFQAYRAARFARFEYGETPGSRRLRS